MAIPSALDTSGLAAFFTSDHRLADDLWGAVESADDADVGAAFEAFDAAVRRHLDWEEQVLFPAFEASVGMPPHAGPTAVMRMEHDQIRALLGQMYGRRADAAALLARGDTLLLLLGQHNQKEEGMLYMMAELHLEDQWSALLERLAAHR